MLIVGSKALVLNKVLPITHPCKDLDIIGTEEEFNIYKSSIDIISTHTAGNTTALILKSGLIIEWELATEGSSGFSLLKLTDSLTGLHTADIDTCYSLKLSHRYKKDSPHFMKTMKDIKMLRSLGAKVSNPLWFKQREVETYKAQRPKLNVNKEDFFKGDDVPYKYDHDSIHKAIAVKGNPAYESYIKDDEDVMCSKDKFNSCCYDTRLLGVVEESMVLCLERSLIHNNFTLDETKMFKYALMKVCTSICGGWFREFAWENYDQALTLFESLGRGYMKNKFEQGKYNDIIKPYKGV